MCGIAGVVALRDGRRAARRSTSLAAMVGGAPPPRPRRVRPLPRRAAPGSAHARLSIIDLATGQQPLSNEDGTLWIVFNGEIFNYVELREELRRARATASGPGATPRSSSTPTRSGATEAFARFNGQFAIALWDATRGDAGPRARPARRPAALPLRARRAALVRQRGEGASSPAIPSIPRALDPVGLAETFTFWTVVAAADGLRGRRPSSSPGTSGRSRAGGTERPRVLGAALSRATRAATLPGHARRGRASGCAPRSRRRSGCGCCGPTCRSAATSRAGSTARSSRRSGRARQGRPVPHLLASASRTPSTTRRRSSARWRRASGASTARSSCAGATSPRRSRTSSRHAERPLLRTAPAPLFLLSRLVRDAGIKVVLTGEGADEMFAGYDLFREAQGPALLGAAAGVDAAAAPPRAALPVPRALAGGAAGDGPRVLRPRPRAVGASPGFAHQTRWQSRRGAPAPLRAGPAREARRASTSSARLLASLPAEFARWSPSRRTSTSRSRTLLSGYLLSSQGDRMLMAHSVEGRFPFLDADVVELANALPAVVQAARPRREARAQAGRGGARPRRRSCAARSSPTARPTRSRFVGPDAPGLGRARC